MQKITIGNVIHGFRVVSVTESGEPEGRQVRMMHEKTGADLFWLDNGAENMVFSITFRTLPQDSTGVFHILEHSVLCGSRRYPVREPFVEMLKSSMSTFLNAMTFPDMTMYPVSSRNPKDLMNLTRVYLDAVFYPTVMTDRKRFCQEGWHINRDENGNPEYRGIVYNEMKGAMSDPDTLIDRQILRQLFPDTCYGYNSGGDPENIPDLTWDAFKETYEQHYHPSNSYIYLDGLIPLEEMLETLDEYMSSYERREDLPAFEWQTPKSSETSIRYEISPEEDTANRSHLTIARITGTWRDRAENLARSIIGDILTGGNEAPLKHAALERKLCQDISLSVDDTGLQSWISIHADNVTDGAEADIMSLLEETGNRILREGLDFNAAEASINRMIFNMREEEEPQGIGRCIRSMGTWLYGGDPAEALQTQPLIRELREMLHNGKLNELAADMLLNRKGIVILHTRPSHTLGAEMIEAEKEQLQSISGTWTTAEQKCYQKMIDELREWQETPDDSENLRKLPVLTKEDADIVPEWTETEESDISGVHIMRHRIPCNGVIHIRAYFPLTRLSLEELTCAGMFAGMLGRLPTRTHNAFELQQEIKRRTGSMGFAVMSRSVEGEDRLCTPYLTAFVSALEENANEALNLMKEVLTETLTEGQEERIREIVAQLEISSRQRVSGAAHMIAVRNTLSRYSADGTVRNALEGEPAVRYIHRFAEQPETEMRGYLKTARRIMEKEIVRDGMKMSITGTAEIEPSYLTEAFPEGEKKPAAATYSCEYPQATGYRIPARIGFAARGYRLNRCGEKFSGIKWLACGILSLGYLWNRVRVQGGSYGAGLQTDRSGNIYSYSFRDPTPGKTLDADNGASGYLQELAEHHENLDKYIISSLNELNPLLSPRDKGALADARMMSGLTREDTERIRKEILNATWDDLVQCGKWLDAFAKEGSICVAAPQEMLNRLNGFDIRDL